VPSIVFWNVNRKDLRHLVCDIANSMLADVVILIESKATYLDTLDDLKTKVSADFEAPKALDGRFQLFCRNASLDLREIYHGERISLRVLSLGEEQLLLGVVHLVDRRNWDPLNQASQVAALALEIRRREKQFRNNKTILIGDFNMNPFDQAMNMAPGLNALMTQKCVAAGSRTLQGKDYPYFYNPMWGLFGDRTPGPAGTYYHTASSQGMYGWNVLDQVLMRPTATAWLEDVEVLVSAGDASLQTSLGRPKTAAASDHFPLILRLKDFLS
jgi:hypothetical protein